jgi:hypothetical protein
MTRSPMLCGRFAPSVFSVAALFLVKRTGGELGVGGSGSFSGRRDCLNEPRGLDSVEQLAGDRGASKLGERIPPLSGMMVVEEIPDEDT